MQQVGVDQPTFGRELPGVGLQRRAPLAERRVGRRVQRELPPPVEQSVLVALPHAAQVLGPALRRRIDTRCEPNSVAVDRQGFGGGEGGGGEGGTGKAKPESEYQPSTSTTRSVAPLEL